jgi:hypothetical protein
MKAKSKIGMRWIISPSLAARAHSHRFEQFLDSLLEPRNLDCKTSPGPLLT